MAELRKELKRLRKQLCQLLDEGEIKQMREEG